MIRHHSFAALAFVLACAPGCGTEAGVDVGGSVPGEGGDPNSLGGASATGGGAPVGVPADLVSSPDSAVLDPTVACVGSRATSTLIQSRPSPAGGFASAQYAKAALVGNHWPDPTVLRAEDFEAYFGNRITPSTQEEALDADVRASVVATGTFLDIRARLRPEASRPPVHLIVVADISKSTGGTLGVRDGALDALARGVATSAADELSLVVFGDPPEVVFEHALRGDALSELEAHKAQLEPRPGNDLLVALDLARTLTDPESPSPSHVLILTDGGVKWDQSLADAIAVSTNLGIATSVAQIGRDTGDPDLAPTMNDALLEGIARAGLGTRLYLPSPGANDTVGTSEADIVFESRYEEVFSVALSQATLDVVLPIGLGPVSIQPGEVIAGPVGYRRAVGAQILIDPECLTPFSTAQQATVHLSIGSAEVDVPLAGADLVLAANRRGQVDAATGLLVKALRSRNAADMQVAADAIDLLQQGLDTPCPTIGCDTTLCCVRAELVEMVQSTCELFPPAANAPQFCD